MTTNNEILMKHKSIADDYSYKYKREDIFDMLKEARADTAKQIFKELEGYIYIFKGNIAFNLNRKEYEAIKKKYKVD